MKLWWTPTGKKPLTILLMGSCYKVAPITENERPVLGPFQADNSSDINNMIALRMGGNLHTFQFAAHELMMGIPPKPDRKVMFRNLSSLAIENCLDNSI